MADKDFMAKHDIQFVKLRKGFYDVLMGNQRQKIGHVCFAYGQWCFCADVGRFVHYGRTRCEAVYSWMLEGFY